MRIGHLLYQPTPDMSYSHHERLRETIEQAQLADELKFDSVVFAENHFSNYGYSPNPVLLAAAIGQHTNDIDMATGVAVLPFWQPLRLAEDIATADHLLTGRLEVTVGRGYQRLEYAGLNIPFEERQERYDEALEIMMQAWTCDVVDFHGKHYQVGRPVAVFPKPYQKPHPRLAVGAVTEESIRAAARTDFKVFGNSWIGKGESMSAREIYLDERAKLGKSGDNWVYAMNRQIFVVDTTSPTEYAAERHEALLRSQEATRLGQGMRDDALDYDRGKITSKPFPGERELESYTETMIFGNPEEVLAQVRALRDVGEVREINIMTDFGGGCEFAKVRRSMELFGKEVLPTLRADEQ
jgi:alkanesulfonate monooxygenase SsuD/methylene tetrahydromethanopterin reductase-like flavin-dependent oxidoreductase (luciferase family)